MKPNIFLHYWNQQDQLISFQELITFDCDPLVLATIQADLLQQLTSEIMQEKLPNFDWDNLRMQEKWNSISQTLLMQVQLPEQIWMDWIQALGGRSAPLQPEVPSFADLLNAEVYFELPSDSLEDFKEEVKEEETEILVTPFTELTEEKKVLQDDFSPEIEVTDLQIVAPVDENPTEAPIIQSTPDYFEVSHELPDMSDLSVAETKPQSIKDMLADSTEEKVLDTLQVNDHSLKNLVANQMTSSLAESISLFQRLNFIQELFDGNAEEFSRFIEFIDLEASPKNWQMEVGERYHFQENPAWHELMQLIERKFS